MSFSRAGLVLLLALVLSSAVLADDWVSVGDDDMGTHYISRSARMPTGHLVFWKRTSLTPERTRKMPYFREFRVTTIEAQVEWDAEAGRYRFRTRILARADRSVVESWDEPTPWEAPYEGSVMVKAIQAAGAQAQP